MGTDTWREFYERRDYDRCAYLEGEDMVEYARALFDRVEAPETFLSVGCGPAVVEFALAEQYPDTRVRCVDAAPEVIADNRDLAGERGLDNLTFEVGTLPDLALGERFEVVYCVATLYFVRDVEAALGALYEHVQPGGHLVVSYPNRNLQEWVRDQDEHTRAFFELVENERNLLTREAVERILDGELRDYWAFVGADVDRSGTVVVRRPPYGETDSSQGA